MPRETTTKDAQKYTVLTGTQAAATEKTKLHLRQKPISHLKLETGSVGSSPASRLPHASAVHKRGLHPKVRDGCSRAIASVYIPASSGEDRGQACLPSKNASRKGIQSVARKSGENGLWGHILGNKQGTRREMDTRGQTAGPATCTF